MYVSVYGMQCIRLSENVLSDVMCMCQSIRSRKIHIRMDRDYSTDTKNRLRSELPGPITRFLKCLMYEHLGPGKKRLQFSELYYSGDMRNHGNQSTTERQLILQSLVVIRSSTMDVHH